MSFGNWFLCGEDGYLQSHFYLGSEKNPICDVKVRQREDLSDCSVLSSNYRIGYTVKEGVKIEGEVIVCDGCKNNPILTKYDVIDRSIFKTKQEHDDNDYVDFTSGKTHICKENTTKPVCGSKDKKAKDVNYKLCMDCIYAIIRSPQNCHFIYAGSQRHCKDTAIYAADSPVGPTYFCKKHRNSKVMFWNYTNLRLLKEETDS